MHELALLLPLDLRSLFFYLSPGYALLVLTPLSSGCYSLAQPSQSPAYPARSILKALLLPPTSTLAPAVLLASLGHASRHLPLRSQPVSSEADLESLRLPRELVVAVSWSSE